MADYRLAIIIPSWNCSRYIAEMLDSIIANTFTDWRCFVVDDQSEDDSCDVIKAYQDKDDRIVLKVRDIEPKGAQTCRNIGFELSNGAEYVIWFDADDIIAPYCLEQRVAYMDRHSRLDFGIFPAKSFVNELWEINDQIFLWGVRYGQDALQDMLKWCLPMVGWTNIYRRSSVIKFGLKWDERILSMQDSDFNISALVKGLKYEFAEDDDAMIDYFYRVCQKDDNNTASKIFGTKHLNSHLYLLNKIFSSLNKAQIVMYKRDLECYAYRFAQIFLQDKSKYIQFLKIPYIRSNYHLWYSLFVYMVLTLYYPFSWKKQEIIVYTMMNRLQRDWEERQNDWKTCVRKRLKTVQIVNF